MLYPEINENNKFWLDVGDNHQVYVEESGNPDGIPVVYCHGGPGGASNSLIRQLFDPELYRIISYDQRACGLSKPFLSIENNTTADLISDLEKIRCYLKIEQWVVAGGSWGTTLALLYAQAYPERVSALLLRGIFLGRKQDLAWLYEAQGAAKLFPDYYQEFIKPISAEHKTASQIIKAYFELLTSDNQIQQLNAAKSWCLWESQISRLHFTPNLKPEATEAHHSLAMALLEAHYFANNCFISENQILDNINKIQHIPATLIHGRYDAVCDLSQAWQLNQAWENSKLLIVPKAGHSLGETAIAHSFCQASKALAVYFQEKNKQD